MTEATQTRKTLGGGLVIAAAMAIMNVTTYGFTMLGAYVLGPRQYSALASVMALLLVVNVLALGLQATAARRVASEPEHVEAIEQAILGVGYRAALALGLLCLVLTPLIDRLLRLDGWSITTLIAVTVIPLTVMGAQAGVLQGERRWRALALVYLAVGLGRIIGGGIGLAVRGDTLGAVAGVAAGAFAPAIVGWFALRGHARVPREKTRLPAGGMLRELAHNSHALLAFFALTNADVLIARTVLDDHESGLYAAGLILAKAVLFLPQFVVVVAFPSMSRPNASRRLHLLGLGLVLGIGAVTTLGVLVLSGLAVLFVGGPKFEALQSQLWAFALLGTFLSMIQMMVYSVLARQHQRMVFVIWAALAVLVTLAPVVETRNFLLTAVLAVDGLLLTCLVGWLLLGHPEPDEEPVPA